MHHELRAILDRFIYEHAGVRHLLFAAPPEADGRVIEGSGWTALQLVQHFAVAQEAYTALIDRWLEGEPIDTRELNPEARSSPDPDMAAASREEVLERYAASLRALFAAFHKIGDVQFARAMAGQPAGAVLAAWSEHQLTHIFPFVKVLPETRYDPVIVNWLARAPAPGDAARAGQREYISDVREYYARLAEDEGDDDD